MITPLIQVRDRNSPVNSLWRARWITDIAFAGSSFPKGFEFSRLLAIRNFDESGEIFKSEELRLRPVKNPTVYAQNCQNVPLRGCSQGLSIHGLQRTDREDRIDSERVSRRQRIDLQERFSARKVSGCLGRRRQILVATFPLAKRGM